LNYIKKVKIENFQSHQDTELEFDEGLNVIVGPSDQGKSAIIRAIKWVLFNEPRGNEFIRQGTSAAKVTIEMNNGYSVIRERSSSKNRYTAVDTEGNINKYEGFGNEVPEEVRKAHGISKVIIDVDSNVSLNIGEQLEGPFLLSESGSVKAKAIGRLTGVHVIDKAIRDCISDIKKENSIENNCLKEMEETNKKLKLYEKLEVIGSEINKRDGLLKKLEASIDRYERLNKKRIIMEQVNLEIIKARSMLEKMSRVNEAELNVYKLSEKILILNKLNSIRSNFSFVSFEAKIQEDTMEKTTNVNSINKILSKLQTKIIEISKLTQLSHKYTNTVELLEKTKKGLEKLGKVSKVEKNIIKLIEITTLKEKFENLSKNNKSLDISIKDGTKYVKSVVDDIEISVKKYEQELRKISRCPVCFSEIDEIAINKVIMQYKEGL